MDDPHPPLPEPTGDTTRWGEHIQRTMQLLATSSAAQSNEVRIVFYGQSITGGRWHIGVERALRERYPHARLVLENRALGGFAASRLIRPLPHDLYAFQPDLVIFHVFGGADDYERIIHGIRQNTVAEVMILTDHWKRNAIKDGKYLLEDHGRFMDQVFLPAVARKYGCELVDVRWPWKQYLDHHGLEPGDLLRDNVHLNDHGRWLMARLCLRQLCHRPDLMTEQSAGLVRTVSVPREAAWNGARLEMEFTGNRVDVVTDNDNGPSLEILIDGIPPSKHPELYTWTRPTSVISPPEWPCLMRIGCGAMPLVETWEIELLSVSEDHETIGFRLTGSQTGYDGEGISRERFVSLSRRVVIEPDDWFIANSHRLRGEIAHPGMKAHWRCEPTHTDLFIPDTHLPAPGEVRLNTLFHGLPNRRHRLVLTQHGLTPPPVCALRVFQPPVPDGPAELLAFTAQETAAPIDPGILEPDS